MLVHLGLGTFKLGLNSRKMVGETIVLGFRGMRRVTGESARWVREGGMLMVTSCGSFEL